MKKACVFCASSHKISEKYVSDARRLGELLVENGWGLIYGGGSTGLMGAVADAVLAKGGEVTGIIPTFMVEVEWAHKGVKDMRQTDNMSQRKRLLIETSDAVITLPGSTGTMDEFFEAMADKKLGLFAKPLILLNTNGFFDHTIAQMKLMVEENFMSQHHLDVLSIAQTPEEVIEYLKAPAKPALRLEDAAVK